MGTFAGFAAALGRMSVALEKGQHEALEECAKLVETTAKDALGTYVFGWAPLAPSTIAQKVTGDSPLLETGALKESIKHSVGGHEALVGTNDPHAAFLELGTSRMPPRPFLSEAARRKVPEMERIVGEKVKTALTFR